MAQQSVNKPHRLVLPAGLKAQLDQHLFPGDGDEHGAVILAGVAETTCEVRLLAREVRLAKDGRDYVPGKRGYRMLRAEFITHHVLQARDERLAYLAVHNHGGTDAVGFSAVDLRSHERGYPALLQIVDGMPVGAVVFAKKAAAGDIWKPDGSRAPLDCTVVVGPRRQILTPRPVSRDASPDPRYDRQIRLFGDRGQHILSKAKVAIIGLGGAGSLLAEVIGRLGVGRFVIIDPDRVERTNLPRLVGANRRDASPKCLGGTPPHPLLRSLAQALSRRKTALAKRNIRRAHREARVCAITSDIVEPNVAAELVDCDFIFLAADTMRARSVFNALVHQYLIPGVQVGAKVVPDRAGGVADVYAVSRLVTAESGCLQCNNFINAAKLQEESLSEEERRSQRYVDDDEVVAPSVITLNASATAQAANDFLFYMTGLAAQDASQDYLRYCPTHRKWWQDEPNRKPDCPDCGLESHSRFGRGDSARLPVKLSSRTRRGG